MKFETTAGHAFEVRFTHVRLGPVAEVTGRTRTHLASHKTRCEILQSERVVAQAVSYCSVRDQFKRQRGEAVALRRALEEAVRQQQLFRPDFTPAFKALSRRYHQPRLTVEAVEVLQQVRNALLHGRIKPSQLMVGIGI